MHRSLSKCRDKYWRCEATDGQKSRCRNRWDGHEKGHQYLRTRVNDTSGLPTLKIGVFKNSFNANAVVEALHKEVFKLLDSDRSTQIRALCHHSRISNVFKIVSNRTCLGCLSNCPVYVLPCENKIQHAICEKCAEHFSNADTPHSTNLTIGQCPFGCSLSTSPWYLRRKPLNAGTRILTLDG